jgi:redox-sensitive bicupin YhaK (pirin superfamily)
VTGVKPPIVWRRIVGPIHDLGDGISVRRVLPSPEGVAVGPFVLLDHLGPLTLAAGLHFDVRPHPHIGLATLTYLWEGRVVHRDGLGVDQTIEPGAVNLMKTGSGIVHSERQADADRGRPLTMHGLQIWIVPPAAQESAAPSFSHTPVDALPRLQPAPGVDLRVVAGTAWGQASPVPVDGPTMYVDARLAAGAHLALPDEHPQRALYVIAGRVAVGAGADDAAVDTAGPGEMLLFTPGASATLTATIDSHVVLLGGAPIDRDWHVWWNFAATSVTTLEASKQAWRDQRWPMVAGDAEFIPLPPDEARTRIRLTGRWQG